MSLEFNVGELANRVRKALGSRGRIPLDLDERVSLEVVLADLDQAPWRADGARWGQWITLGAVAGNFTDISIAAPGGNTTLVVDTIIHYAAAVPGSIFGKVVNAPTRAYVAIQVPETFSGRTAGGAADPENKGAASYASVVVAANTLALLGLDYFSRIEVAGQQFQSVEITVPPGWEFLLENQTVNLATTVYVGGRAYSQQIPTP